jgi:DinB family protein
MDQEVAGDIRFLRLTPSRLLSHFQSISPSSLRTRANPDMFSMTEQACHLRDLEEEAFAVRLSRMISEANPEMKDFDGARIAIERAYNEQDGGEALAAFTRARERNVETISTLDDSILSRTGMLEGVGEITLRRLISMMREHDEGHLEEIETLINQLSRG